MKEQPQTKPVDSDACLNISAGEFRIKYYVVFCGYCGIAFAMPAALYDARADQEKSIRCPGCSGKLFPKPKAQTAPDVEAKALAAENRRLKRQVVRLIHDSEQAEGRRSDANVGGES